MCDWCFFVYSQAVEETDNNSASNLISHATSSDVASNSTTQVTEIVHCRSDEKVRHRSRFSVARRSASCSGSPVRPHTSLDGTKSPLEKYGIICCSPAGDTSGVCQYHCLERKKHTTESPHSLTKVLLPEYHDSLLLPESAYFTPQSSSFHHSTPEDRDSATASHMISSNASESMCLSKDDCLYEDVNTSAAARDALSWHDFMNFEQSSTRSCVSMDDSLFLRDLNVEGSNEAEVLATCTAVSSLEQLEQEVAGVLSDCGDMERCFDALQQSDDVKAVVSRYSLGVADCVLAADKCARWQESVDSPIIDEVSLSSSMQPSGFIWDYDGFDLDSPSIGMVQISRRATRSMSPLPAVRCQQTKYRASLGSYVDSRVNGNTINWTGFDNNDSADLAPCSVYDVNRRLSGRLHAQHVSD